MTVSAIVSEKEDLRVRKIVLNGVLIVPDLHINLLSCSKLCRDGFDIRFGRYRCCGVKGGILQFHGGLIKGVYYAEAEPAHNISGRSQSSALAERRPTN